NLVGVWNTRTLCNASSLLDQLSCRRSLGDESERTVFVYGDLNWNNVTALRLGRCVVSLAEFHDVDAVLTKGWTDWRSWVSSTCLDLQLDESGDLFLWGHVGSFYSCVSRGTGAWHGDLAIVARQPTALSYR